MYSISHRLIGDRGGNFGMLTALVLPVLLGAGGLAIDVGNMMISKRNLQEATDAAALAAATSLARDANANAESAKALALNFFKGQIKTLLPAEAVEDVLNATTATVATTTSATGKRFDVTFTSTYTMPLTPFMAFLGRRTTDIAASSSTSSGISQTKKALSMMLVLDESGSMLANTNEKIEPAQACKQYNTSGSSIGTKSPCYVKKIDALKTAANLLLDQLDQADPNSKYVRTNAIAWSGSIQDVGKFEWGTTKTRNGVVENMAGGGNTESYAPMKKAYDLLSSTGGGSETKIHADVGNSRLTKYIVFMTDGENNNASSDTKTLTVCADAKSAGIKIYSVAFMAPTRGQSLLSQCATGSDYYFKAESMADLLATFKAIGEEASASNTLLTQ